MTAREEIITFAKQHLKKDVVYYRDGAELEWDDIKDLYEAAQRQAYERAAEVCMKKWKREDSFDAYTCSKAILAHKVRNEQEE